MRLTNQASMLAHHMDMVHQHTLRVQCTLRRLINTPLTMDTQLTARILANRHYKQCTTHHQAILRLP